MHCPYCFKSVEFITSKEFYGVDYKTNLYVCRPCDARVGTHGNSDKALGTLANKQLRALRMACHYSFDKTWKTRRRRKNAARTRAYRWLQAEMNLTEQEAHIGRFDVEQCKKLLSIMNKMTLEQFKERIDYF